LEIAVLKVILPENAAAHSLSSLVPLSPLPTPSGREGVVTIIFYSAVTTRPKLIINLNPFLPIRHRITIQIMYLGINILNTYTHDYLVQSKHL
jgi:hypothetical protein